jgi:hypothetical protein
MFCSAGLHVSAPELGDISPGLSARCSVSWKDAIRGRQLSY